MSSFGPDSGVFTKGTSLELAAKARGEPTAWPPPLNTISNGTIDGRVYSCRCIAVSQGNRPIWQCHLAATSTAAQPRLAANPAGITATPPVSPRTLMDRSMAAHSGGGKRRLKRTKRKSTKRKSTKRKLTKRKLTKRRKNTKRRKHY